MKEMREILLNEKLFKENFIYNDNYLLEETEVRHVSGIKIPSLRCIPLRYRRGRLFIDKIYGLNQTLYLPNEEGRGFKSGDWVACIPTGNKNTDNYVLREIEVIINLFKTTDSKRNCFKRLKKVLETRGIEVSFTPCKLCNCMANLTPVGDEVYCESCRAKMEQKT